MLNVNKNCTACGACVQICPQKCIQLEKDSLGFEYPSINAEQCINCGLCEKSCHLNYPNMRNTKSQRAYAAIHTSTDVCLKSTSGGAFGAIAEHVLQNHGVVYGCGYSEELKAVHMRVDRIENLIALQGSKYVQSEIGDTYFLAKQDLLEQKTVLFSGTPCQIAGLKAFLGKEYSNLLTVDFVCHGVPPYALFKKYLAWFEKKHSMSVKNYDFRAKANAGWGSSGMASGVNKNGLSKKRKIFYHNEYYYHYFLTGEISRDSCYVCKYANLDRPGDFSLGDLWGAEGFDLPFSIQNGCSLLLANNEKANKLLSVLSLVCTEISIDQASKNNAQLMAPIAKSKSRDEILRSLADDDPLKIDRDFRKKYFLHRLKGKIKHLVPNKLRHVILRYKYKNNHG